ncbi:similar to Saccharomyces cerevisiae YJR096W Putative xylose and arabinose reductase [Maudiozyma barnettii]|uniref:Similar to Saccharomyces cerevisiae YJR096W Putative xylose and arabinose reductase n=1 Tax=Maudiozyma barnettii TaxID=61262 RepID=A0A8H2VH65_9SACH|nr:uncharacterized protein KABA2_06S08998 [Kazachstania barnettii]CAB4255589.1 similar to Saccharomyces cerevisiae YJR096W Putative xylose and arabinose reductase [Kazachstania barnettii]CAD1784087.1 similar to Saccharomyces cerevisiae YJR096W Putative xylose and arabinose reductase [Kazachstania barnettii]
MSGLPQLKTLNNGVQIPELGLGLWQTPESKTANIVYEALKVGYRHFDSAQWYANEKGAAKGIIRWLKEDPKNHKRKDVFFTTKVKDPSHGYENTKQSIKESLEQVKGIGYIDLVLVHSPQSNKNLRLGTWKALQELVNEGVVKSIGVSNYGVPHIQEILKWDEMTIKPVINQVEINPWLTRKEIVNFCHKNGIEVEAYSPLTRGKRLNDPALMKIAKKYGKQPAQILIKWSIQKGFIVLPKTTHEERLLSNIDVFDFTISDEDITQMTYDDEYQVFCSWDPTTYRG